MSFADFERIADDLPVNTDRVHLQGLGEPLLHKDFFRMVNHVTSKGIRVTASTNLSTLDEKTAVNCVSSGLELLHVSIDAPDRATYEAIRRGASYDRLLNNLHLLLEAKRTLHSATPALHVTTVVMRQNLPLLPDIVAFAARFRFTQVFVQQLCHSFEESTISARYLPLRAFFQEQVLDGERQETVDFFFARARKVAEDVKVELRLPKNSDRESARASRPCDWPWTGVYISHEGYVMPCCMVSTPDRVNFGNVFERGLLGIWEGKAYRAFRAKLLSDDPPDVCLYCSVYNGRF